MWLEETRLSGHTVHKGALFPPYSEGKAWRAAAVSLSFAFLAGPDEHWLPGLTHAGPHTGLAQQLPGGH